MNNNWYIYTKKGWKKMNNKGFYLWAWIVIAGLLALLIIQTYRYRQESKGGFTCQQAVLAFHHRIPEKECWITPDLWKKYKGRIFLSERGKFLITEISGRGYRNTLFIRGSESPRPIMAVFVTQKFLRERRE